jgi:hypothetical protein
MRKHEPRRKQLLPVAFAVIAACALAVAPGHAAATEADMLISLEDSQVAGDAELAATAVPLQAAAATDGERRRLLALGCDQGVSRRLVQRIDTPAWTRTPFDDVVMSSARAEMPLGGAAGSDSIPAAGPTAP